MAAITDSRWDAGIGITEALKLVRLCISAMKYGDTCHSYPRFSGYLDGYDSRCSTIEDQLQQAGHRRTAYHGMTLSDTALTINTLISSALENVRSEGIRSLDTAVVRLEEEMRKHGLVQPEQSVQWIWDDHRKDYYYWVAEGYFQYHKGGKVKPDGTPYGEAAASQTPRVDGDEESKQDDDTLGEDSTIG